MELELAFPPIVFLTPISDFFIFGSSGDLCSDLNLLLFELEILTTGFVVVEI
jgi:hypothetical protein